MSLSVSQTLTFYFIVDIYSSGGKCFGEKLLEEKLLMVIVSFLACCYTDKENKLIEQHGKKSFPQ